jgi:hypothetical protein
MMLNDGRVPVTHFSGNGFQRDHLTTLMAEYQDAKMQKLYKVWRHMSMDAVQAGSLFPRFFAQYICNSKRYRMREKT